MAFVDIENLDFKYALGSNSALDSISLTIDEGEFILLCGPSGCGKTTLLRQLKPELRPHGERRGRIMYEGRPAENLSQLESAGGIGLVMQNPESQIVTDVVYAELAFGLENLGVEPGVIRRRVAEMASFFGIGSWFHKKTSELSGGQKQILNLAAILCMQPRLLLLDEPTAMLDPVASGEFAEMIARLNREFGLTVVMAAHRLDDVFHLATRVAFMRDGRILTCEKPTGYGGFVKDYPQYTCFMPAALRICAGTQPQLTGDCPVTVREGKNFLNKRLGAFKSAKPRPIPSPDAAANKKHIEPALRCDDVSFRYESNADGADIIRSLTMEAYAGQLCCILGENGAGKSTLLNLLAGLLRPSRGRILIGGKNILKLDARAIYQENVALLPQNPKALFVCETLLEDLKVTAETSGTGHGELVAIAAELGLEGLLERHPYDLSGGESKRAALAKLLLTRPKILLLDEPTSSLDALSQASLSALLCRLCDNGACVVAITHDMDFAAENADRCLLLFDGGISCEGTPREFFGGNCFYTTAANRIARGIDAGAITCGDVIGLCEDAR